MLYVVLSSGLFLFRNVVSKKVILGRQTYILVLLGLFLFSAFRYQVGCDWSGYYFQYLAATNFDWGSLTRIQEPIWWAFLGWINSAELAYPVANVVSSAIFFAGVHVLARRQPDPLGFLVLLFPILIVNMPMSGIRQGAAIGIVCIAFASFIDRRPLQFSFWVLVAAGFHSSALIMLLLLPLATGHYTRNRLILAAIMALPGVSFLASSEAAVLATNRYVGTGIDSSGAVFRVGILGLSALHFFLFVRKKWVVTWTQDYSLVSIGALCMALTFLLLPISTVIADRVGYYLIPIQTMIFARLPFIPFGKKLALHSTLPYAALLFIFTIWTQLSLLFEQCYLPYQSWIFGFPGGDPVGF